MDKDTQIFIDQFDLFSDDFDDDIDVAPFVESRQAEGVNGVAGEAADSLSDTPEDKDGESEPKSKLEEAGYHFKDIMDISHEFSLSEAEQKKRQFRKPTKRITGLLRQGKKKKRLEPERKRLSLSLQKPGKDHKESGITDFSAGERPVEKSSRRLPSAPQRIERMIVTAPAEKPVQRITIQHDGKPSRLPKKMSSLNDLKKTMSLNGRENRSEQSSRRERISPTHLPIAPKWSDPFGAAPAEQKKEKWKFSL